MKRVTSLFDEETAVRMTERLLGHLEHGTTDLADDVLEVPSDVYTDPGLLRRELDTVFRRAPLVAAHTTQLQRENDFVVVPFPEVDVLVVRQPDGGVAAFRNECRHRGTPLAEGCGNNRVFTCPYHGWAYDADGSLRNITFASVFGDVDPKRLGLVEFPCEERHGFVWVVLDPEASIDMVSWLGPEMDELLGALCFDSYHLHHTEVYDEPSNWKLIADAGFDNYHLRYLHPRSVGKHIHTNVHVFEEMDRHARFVTPRKRIADYVSKPPGTPLDHYVIVAHMIMPNLLVTGQPDHYEVWTFRPDAVDPARSVTEIRFLLPDPAETPEDKAHFAKNLELLNDPLMNEDMPMSRGIQVGLRGMGHPPLRFGRNEPTNQFFHRQLARIIAGE